VSANGEPRKVHTEVIRPNPNQMAAADIGQPVAPPLTVASTPPSPPPAPAKQPAPRTKQAAQTPAAQPTEAAPAREAAPTGGYVVQLSSQKTEEEARASFKVLATKYAAVFGDREPYIKRVNIPEKGTFYRANVGPFATSSEANHFCSNLKIVGGQCIVQKN
jgi:cell division septation protein DedD